MPEPRQAGHPSAATTADTIPHSRPAIGEQEEAAVLAVLESGQLAQGTRVDELERTLAAALRFEDATGGRPPARGVAVSSGTAALYVALRALGVGEGDEVVIPAYVCASLNQAVRLTGATPRFVDCDPGSLNPDPDDARRKLSAATAACIVPHLFGLPSAIESFVELGAPVIEDCAQTLGVAIEDRPVGGFGAMTVCSFYATKLIAGGEGGMVLSGDAGLISKAATFRDCEEPRSDALSFNFKMSDLHAAVALVQLARLPAFLDRRRRLAAKYSQALSAAELHLPTTPEDREHAWFRFVVALQNGGLDELLERSEVLGLACRRPVGRLVPEVLERLEELPGCRQAWEHACSIPLYPALSDAAADRVIERFQAALGEPR